ncbi:beta-phosphoglucomutase family hydrolase [Nocardia sp. NPDC058176]|uniref:beta-phosphoglucomutase family hydrolase n=1 Tax=Nocardia sp. NPDC058176 TaxID=3346368 RepID=UPI0036DE6368
MRLEHLPVPAGRTANGFGAVVFDMDGVVTDTASVHAAAWKRLFDDVLPRLADGEVAGFDIDADYRRHVDGRSRDDGIRCFLAARAITVPDGSAQDGPDALTVAGMAARKQDLFAAELARSGVRVFPDAAALLHRLRATRVPTALVTASANCAAVLDAAGLAEAFTVRVDGTDALRDALPGKPDPAMFLEAARRLRVAPIDAVVLEDATAGVQAAVEGRFGLVIGVDRVGSAALLAQVGADIVVTDLADLALVSANADPIPAAAPRWGGGAVRASSGGWNLIYDDFDPAQEGTREALCTTGNGYWASRGAAAGSVADEVHYPGTYLAGIYNRVVSTVGARVIETEHLVNAPDWTFVALRHADGTVLRPGGPDMVGHHQNLNVRAGILTCIDRYADGAGRQTTVTTRRFHSMADPYVAVLELSVQAQNWTGELVVESTVEGAVGNRNVAADAALNPHHVDAGTHRSLDDETILYEARTTQSGLTIATATRTRIDGTLLDRRVLDEPARAGVVATVRIGTADPVLVEKVAVVSTARDRGISTPGLAAADRIARAPRASALRDAHVTAWAQLWDRFAIRLSEGHDSSLALNLHVFHVLQAVHISATDVDVGVPPRGLHGEGYRGHIFWDELFVHPMLTLRQPELTRALLQYRYERLARARDAARAAGLDGALFPWQSGSDGREETPAELFNVRNGRWMPDHSHRQRHVGLAVAYSIWQYYQTTGDERFLVDTGAEIMVEVARAFAAMAVYDPADDRFDIDGVMGPDEYHDGGPDSPGRGLRNNAYTNVLAAWTLTRARDVVRLLHGRDCASLWHRLQLRADEPLHWDRVGRRLRVPFHRDGVISQFEGYEELAEFDWAAYRARYGNIERLDLILHAEGDTTNRYKLSKQADVLMLFYLFSAEELRHVLERLGYSLAPEIVPRTVEYYLARTSHGSTLSRLAHAWVLARTDRAASWSLFARALEADLADTQGGTTREGVHLGAMAGTADMVLRCYCGIETRHDVLRLHPVLPAELPEVEFTVSYRGQPVTVSVTHTRVRLRLHPSAAEPIRVDVEGIERVLAAGQIWEVPLAGGARRAR